MGQAITVPITLPLLTIEQLPISIDMAYMLNAGDVVSAPVTTITNLSTQEAVPSAILVAPTVSGSTVVNLTLAGSPLRPNQNYYLTATFTATNAGYTKTMAVQLALQVYGINP